MLKCKECGFESHDLVPHIDEKHNLEEYIPKWGIQDKSELVELKVPKSKDDDLSYFEIGAIKIPKRESLSEKIKNYIPSRNEFYVFENEFMEDVAQDIVENKRVMLVGHTGCGKTSGIEQLANRTQSPVTRVNLNGQTTISDFVGTWTVKGGETVWVDGSLPKAMREGHWLILDEIDFAEPHILSVLNSVLEVGGKLSLKEKGYELITPHEDFRIFATANTIGCMQDFRSLYQGTNIMNEAFLDRWRVYKVNYLPREIEEKIIKSILPKLNSIVIERLCLVANMVRESFIEGDISCTFSTRRLIDWAHQSVRKAHPIKAADSTIFSKISNEDTEVIKGIMHRVLAIKETDEAPTSSPAPVKASKKKTSKKKTTKRRS